jgi:hypothetical protein
MEQFQSPSVRTQGYQGHDPIKMLQGEFPAGVAVEEERCHRRCCSGEEQRAHKESWEPAGTKGEARLVAKGQKNEVGRQDRGEAKEAIEEIVNLVSGMR